MRVESTAEVCSLFISPCSLSSSPASAPHLPTIVDSPAKKTDAGAYDSCRAPVCVKLSLYACADRIFWRSVSRAAASSRACSSSMASASASRSRSST